MEDRKEIELEGKTYKYRYKFTLGQASKILDESFKFNDLGQPFPSVELLKVGTIKAAIPEMNEQDIRNLPEHVGDKLYSAILTARNPPLSS